MYRMSEEARRAAEKIHRSRSEEKRIEHMTTLEQQREITAKIIEAEYADLRAENERLKDNYQTMLDANMETLADNAALRIAELEQQVAALRADAERYAFIRDETVVDDATFVGHVPVASPDTMSIAFAWEKDEYESLDAAIDSARTADAAQDS